MAALIGQGGLRSAALAVGWQCLSLPAGPAETTPPPDGAAWKPVIVPGPPPEGAPGADGHALDHWYRCDVALPPGAWLEFGGLATFAEVWIDGVLVATSSNMFVPLTVPVPAPGGSRLDLCFRALRPMLRRPAPGRRARWRGRLATEEGLRHVRTTLLGHMPGWSGSTAVIGPTRPIMLHRPVDSAPVITQADVRTTILPNGTGRIAVALQGTSLGRSQGTITAAGRTATLIPSEDRLCATLDIADPPLWWPHTHGEPQTVRLTGEIGGVAIDFGNIGFRTIERRDPAQGFGLLINGAPVFCRGAIWTGLDATACPADPAALRRSLLDVRRAGLNMLRVCGMTTYEDSEFFRLCDELGIMVWHDFMFARFDYPDSASFADIVRDEAAAFLDRVQAHPSLTVLCGGTENAQTASMSGRPPAEWRAALFDQVLAEQAASLRPDIPYVPQSPLAADDDAVPFAESAAISHYFGVGAYQRPLAELRSGNIRFASECLAFANLAEPATNRLQPRSTAAPRDPGAAWDFADVRDHYTLAQFGSAASSTRRHDASAWQELGRISVALVMQEALAAWRTEGRCAGALILMWQDLVPSDGWGIVAEDGRPKSAWYALRSVCQPIQVIIRDAGLDGVVIYVINETGSARKLNLGLRGLAPDGSVDALGEICLDLAPNATRAVPAHALMGRWRDLTNTWQFGPPAFTVLGATLVDADTGNRLSEAALFPAGPALPRSEPALTVQVRDDALEIAAKHFAQFIQLDDDSHVPLDNYFHLWPGESRVVQLIPRAGTVKPAFGTARALNGFASVAYGQAA